MEASLSSQKHAPTTNVSKADYVDALNDYYRRKHEYDDKYEEHKNTIKESNALTMPQKQPESTRMSNGVFM